MDAILPELGFLDQDHFFDQLLKADGAVSWRELSLSKIRVILNVTYEEVNQLTALLIYAVSFAQLFVNDLNILLELADGTDLILLYQVMQLIAQVLLIDALQQEGVHRIVQLMRCHGVDLCQQLFLRVRHVYDHLRRYVDNL